MGKIFYTVNDLLDDFAPSTSKMIYEELYVESQIESISFLRDSQEISKKDRPENVSIIDEEIDFFNY